MKFAINLNAGENYCCNWGIKWVWPELDWDNRNESCEEDNILVGNWQDMRDQRWLPGFWPKLPGNGEAINHSEHKISLAFILNL